MLHHRLLFCWITLLKGVSCQLQEDYQNYVEDVSGTSTQPVTSTPTMVVSRVESYTVDYVSVFPHNHITAVTPSSVSKSELSQITEPMDLYEVEPSAAPTIDTTTAYLSNSNSDWNTPKTFTSRGDILIQLNSEESMDEISEPLYAIPILEGITSFSSPMYMSEVNSTDIPLSARNLSNLNDTRLNDSFRDQVHNLARSEDKKEDEKLLVFLESTDSKNTEFNNAHNISQTFPEKVTEDKKIITATQTVDVITVFTFSPLQLQDKWIWFYMILRGNCYVVNLKNSEVLFYDFIKSFSDLLLYNREHILVDAMTCTQRRMTVNMSIDSEFYPNCEKDIKTLLAHTNLRVNLNNTSFYIHSYETRRTLIFETKQDTDESKSDILYMTLGGVGISLICIMFGGTLFSIYQCCIVKKTKHRHIQPNRYLCESPRSLRPKFEIDQSMRFSDQLTYSVNMYKSYSDLTATDLYSHLSSPNHSELAKENSPKKTTILTRIPKEKKKEKNKNSNKTFGLNECETYQECWSESVSQNNEDFMTFRNLNTMTSSFRGNVRESERDSLHPLLKQGMPLLVPRKYAISQDDLPLPPPPPLHHPTTCPSSPAVGRGVLDRIDHLSNGYSNSSPDINVTNTYTRAYSNTTVNISSASSAVFGGAAMENSNLNKECPPRALLKATTPSDTTAATSSSASAENLCLTRITFMGMDNPYFRMETDM